MRMTYLLEFVIPLLVLAGCSRPVSIVDYPPLDWSVNGQILKDTGCVEPSQETCPTLVELGCDKITTPGFYLGGLQPPYPVLECIHLSDEPPNIGYFKQLPGLDKHYRSYAINLDNHYKLLINKSEFKEIFAPVDSSEEAISYAMAMTSLGARFDLDPDANVDYQVDQIEETHVEKTPDGYLVYLFDWSHKMGCDTHPYYAVKVLVTPEGDVHEVDRQVIYTSNVCFDFSSLTLDEN